VEFQHKRQVREYFNLDYDPSETEILEQSYDKEDLTKIPHYDSEAGRSTIRALTEFGIRPNEPLHPQEIRDPE
jgi:hypothetical protein